MNATCPKCLEEDVHLITKFDLLEDAHLIDQIKSVLPAWKEEDGICSHCLDELHQRMMRQISSEDNTIFTPLPIPMRMNAVPVYSGKGVTICVIDSGFYLHPDIEGRVKIVVDITDTKRDLSYFKAPHDESWHGTMTSVVAAGNGNQSNGIYKSLASEAELVLLKVMDENGISPDNITKAIQWAIKNRKKYNIRVINLSVTGDWPISYKYSKIDQAVEEAVSFGINVVAAVGNDSNGSIIAPVNAPSVISVGGLDDYNTLGFERTSAYHPEDGISVNDFTKPEIVAPGIWIPVPILPETEMHYRAQALFSIHESDDISFWLEVLEHGEEAGLSMHEMGLKMPEIRSIIQEKLRADKIVAKHYMHGDGTSFAAPIVSSLIAQMLEANPSLTPPMIREILLGTAKFLKHIPAEIQGFGLVCPALALEQVMSEIHVFHNACISPDISHNGNKISFNYHNDSAHRVEVAGSFNGWSEKIDLSKNEEGIWTASIPILPHGKYHYKYVIDYHHWTEDPANLFKESDGHNGFNSVLLV